jgi:uroporphyrinogen III methyltransferase/synthase
MERLEAGTVDTVTFTSSSTARNFHALLPPDRRASLMEGITVASIGPVTSDTARSLGFTVDVEAASYTIEGLCEALVQAHRPIGPTDGYSRSSTGA